MKGKNRQFGRISGYRPAICLQPIRLPLPARYLPVGADLRHDQTYAGGSKSTGYLLIAARCAAASRSATFDGKPAFQGRTIRWRGQEQLGQARGPAPTERPYLLRGEERFEHQGHDTAEEYAQHPFH